MAKPPPHERYRDDRMRFVIPDDHDPTTQTCVGYEPYITIMPQLGKAQLVWMEPGAFLDFVDPNFNPDPSEFNWLREQIIAGRCFAPVMVSPDQERLGGVLPHEGRHRAWLARELGIKRVPVLLVRRKPSHWPRRKRRYTKINEENRK